MHIDDIFARVGTTFSFEFFPPATDEAGDELLATVGDLAGLHPSFVSVTYGAGGSTRDRTQELVLRIRRETACDPMPHLTCAGHSRAEVLALLGRYAEAGISNVLALRGDTPDAGLGGDFRHAADLVRAIRRFEGAPGPRGFGIAVAGFPEGHPETPNRLTEIDHLKAKVDEGANFIITQMFFENRDFYDFRERCELASIRVPIVAGIMPVTSIGGMNRMASLALGARFPARLQRAIARCDGEREAVRRVGVHWATEQCRDLLDNAVAGLHFYTLNRSTATRDIYASLGVKDSLRLAAHADRTEAREG